LFHHGRQDQRHRPGHRGPAGRNVARRIQGAQSAVQEAGHHRRRAHQDPAAERKRREIPHQPGAMGPCPVHLDHAQDHQRPRDDFPTGLEIRHHAR
ncbi:hypothetical protein LTR94_035665, partial [Friedmanniomyces endolithicus]